MLPAGSELVAPGWTAWSRPPRAANSHTASVGSRSCSQAANADASNQLTIQRVVNRVDNELATANSIVAVFINNHTAAHGVVGIS